MDLFFLDYENEEHKDNAGFVLKGATELAVSAVGAVVLLTSALM